MSKIKKYGKRGLKLTRTAMKNKDVRMALRSSPEGRAGLIAYDLAESRRKKNGKRKKSKSYRKPNKRPVRKSVKSRKKRK